MYQYRGTNYKIHNFFLIGKKLSSKNGTKDCIRFKLYLYIKRGFWVGLAQLWFSSLYRIGKLWGVCAFVWKSVCIRESVVCYLSRMCGTEHWLVTLTFILVWDWLRMCTDMTWLVWRGSGIFSKFLDVSCCNFFFFMFFLFCFATCHIFQYFYNLQNITI